ncbi:hypothetical protein MRX96_034460 [Rhipicephalus microplus]
MQRAAQQARLPLFSRRAPGGNCQRPVGGLAPPTTTLVTCDESGGFPTQPAGRISPRDCQSSCYVSGSLGQAARRCALDSDHPRIARNWYTLLLKSLRPPSGAPRTGARRCCGRGRGCVSAGLRFPDS